MRLLERENPGRAEIRHPAQVQGDETAPLAQERFERFGQLQGRLAVEAPGETGYGGRTAAPDRQGHWTPTIPDACRGFNAVRILPALPGPVLIQNEGGCSTTGSRRWASPTSFSICSTTSVFGRQAPR